jgi:hypothetical protein
VCDVLSEVAVREGILQLLIGKKREEELLLKNFLLEMGIEGIRSLQGACSVAGEPFPI